VIFWASGRAEVLAELLAPQREELAVALLLEAAGPAPLDPQVVFVRLIHQRAQGAGQAAAAAGRHR
jgi:hypothetical protein